MRPLFVLAVRWLRWLSSYEISWNKQVMSVLKICCNTWRRKSVSYKLNPLGVWFKKLQLKALMMNFYSLSCADDVLLPPSPLPFFQEKSSYFISELNKKIINVLMNSGGALISFMKLSLFYLLRASISGCSLEASLNIGPWFTNEDSLHDDLGPLVRLLIR
jgi:hypothetical protein